MNASKVELSMPFNDHNARPNSLDTELGRSSRLRTQSQSTESQTRRNPVRGIQTTVKDLSSRNKVKILGAEVPEPLPREKDILLRRPPPPSVPSPRLVHVSVGDKSSNNSEPLLARQRRRHEYERLENEGRENDTLEAIAIQALRKQELERKKRMLENEQEAKQREYNRKILSQARDI